MEYMSEPRRLLELIQDYGYLDIMLEVNPERGDRQLAKDIEEYLDSTGVEPPTINQELLAACQMLVADWEGNLTEAVRAASTAIESAKEMSNPNPMNARCGLEDCDCDYTIGGLLRRLEMIAEQATATVERTRAECTENLVAPCQHGLECPCYQAGYDAERRP